MTLLYIIQAVIGFGVLVFVHELGHFLAAKWIKVKVEAFSLGFGPFIKYKRGDTEYRLSAIPLGGYVKMAGEEPQEGKTPEPGDFYSKPVGQRAFVFVAGVTMNLIFGFIFFIVAYGVGVPVVPAVVGEVSPGSPAWKAGLQRGDRVVEIDDISPPVDFEDLTTSSILAGSDKKVRLRVVRGEETFSTVVEPQYVKEIGRKSMGILPPQTMTLAPADDIPRRSRRGEGDLGLLYRSGLKGGDVIRGVRIQGTEEIIPVATPQEFMLAVDQCGGQPIFVHYTREGGPSGGTGSFVRVKPEPAGDRMLGVKFGSTHVEAVRPGSWAAEMGLRDGDVIESVGGVETKRRGDVLALLTADRATETPLRVRRDGAVIELALPAAPLAQGEVERALAFDTAYVVDGLMPGYPAAAAGIRAGDVLKAVNGETLTKPWELAEAVFRSKPGESLTIAWERDGRRMEARITPQNRWQVMLPLKSPQEVVRAGLTDSMSLGLRKTWHWVGRIYVTIARLISGDVSLQNVNGPISIGYIVYAAAGEGLGMLLYFLGILSINLAVFNLLPIPVLDGGHLVFALVEKLQGKAVKDRVREYATYAGYALILGLLVIAFWNDIKMFILSKWM